MKPTLLDIARELLRYDPETGLLHWRNARGGQFADSVAGTPNGCGYMQVSIASHLYRCHRICWAMTYGEWPKGDIDHINGVRDDNRLANLRVTTRSENQQNQRTAHSNSITGLLGVSRNKQRWKARIKLDGKQIHLGTFDTPEIAHAAYLKAKRELHPKGML